MFLLLFSIFKNLLIKLGFVHRTAPGLIEMSPEEFYLVEKAVNQYLENRIYEFEGYQIPTELSKKPDIPDLQWFMSGLNLRKKLNKVQKSFSF